MNIAENGKKLLETIAQDKTHINEHTVFTAYAQGAQDMQLNAMDALAMLVNELGPYITGLDSEEIGSIFNKAVKSLVE